MSGLEISLCNCYIMVKEETRTFPVHHLAGRVLIYDWFIRNFIMIVCEKKILVRIYPKHFLINIHYKTIYELVRSQCYSWRVFMNSVPFILPIFGGHPTPPRPPKSSFSKQSITSSIFLKKLTPSPPTHPTDALPLLSQTMHAPPIFPKE